MARKALIEKNKKRKKQVILNKVKRTELRKLSKKGDHEAQIKLARMSRDASYVRVRNRDSFDGRPRGYMRRFGVSRINFRNLAHEGKIPGVKKASW